MVARTRQVVRRLAYQTEHFTIGASKGKLTVD